MTLDLFREAQNKIESEGYQPGSLIFDGKIHRFQLDPKDTKKSGWYIGYHDEPDKVFLVFSDWKGGNQIQKYCFSTARPGGQKTDVARIRSELDRIEAQAKREQNIRQETASLEATRMWASRSEVSAHPYLQNKNLDGLYGAGVIDNLLIIPVKDIEGKIWGLQKINERGEKLFLSGTKKKGCFFPIGFDTEALQTVYVCEGFATGCSIHKATAMPVAVAFDAGNLRPVALELKTKHPHLTIIIAADADEVGIKKAESAARAINGDVLIPKFSTENPSLTDFNDLLKTEGENKVKEQIQAFKIKTPNTEFNDWFQMKVEEYSLSFDYPGRTYFGKSEKKLTVVRAKLYNEARSFSRKFTQADIDGALTLMHEDVRVKYLADIKTKILPYKGPQAEIELSTFVSTIAENPNNLTLSAIKHFIWQVKRKLLGLPVERHMMIVLTGKTGSGKTVAIRKLLEPLGRLSMEASLDIISDQRQYSIFHDFYSIYFDEMARAERADLQSLKRIITSDSIDYRILGSNMHQVATNKSTFIGSSNDDIDTILKDPTSNRRWLEIRSKDLCDWETINALNYALLWNAVDPLTECPLNEHLDELQAVQAKQRYRTSTELFIEDLQITPSNEWGATTVDLYEKYADWAEKSGLKPINKIHFSREFPGLGFKAIRIGHSQARGWLCYAPDMKLTPVGENYDADVEQDLGP